MKIAHLGLPVLIATLMTLTSCGKTPAAPSTSTPAPPATLTAILDPCGPENVALVAKPINDVMLQFDDYATLASHADKTQLVLIIPNMQTIRRVAGARTVPDCLLPLQQHQLEYMDATLITLLEFQRPDPRAGQVATGIVQAQYYHQAYASELVRLLHVTLTPPASPVAVTGTP
jgi:hypothetical protein